MKNKKTIEVIESIRMVVDPQTYGLLEIGKKRIADNFWEGDTTIKYIYTNQVKEK